MRGTARPVVVFGLVAGAIVAAVLAGRSSGSPNAVLQVAVSGHARVVAAPGHHVCTTRCAWRFHKGTRVRLTVRARRGSSFLGWQGACIGRRCSVVPKGTTLVVARFEQRGSDGLQSWNFHTKCKPIKTTIEAIVGSAVSERNGPTETGGRFPSHLRGPNQQHLLNPPCSVDGRGIFVELDDVAVADEVEKIADGDVSTRIVDPNRPGITNVHLKRLSIEIDGTWFGAHVAWPPLPAEPARVDIQGFIFWDTGHTDADWHDFTGWELHPVSAWFPAIQPSGGR